MTLEEIVQRQTHPDYERVRNTALFLRAALEGRLLGDRRVSVQAAYRAVHPEAVELTHARHDEAYLVRFPFESEVSYRQRLALAIDGGESYRVLAEFIGHLLRPGYTLTLDGFSDDLVRQITLNIDGEGTDFQNFVADVAYEVCGLGAAYYLVESRGDSLVVYGIRREHMRDYARAGDDYAYVIFDRVIDTYTGIWRQRRAIRQLITPDTWGYYDPAQNAFVQRDDNPVGFVPIVEIINGSDGRSLVHSVATIQYLLLNAESVLAQKIRNQAIAILNGPVGIREQLTTLSTNKVVELPPDASRGLEWAAYPASSLDADFKYLQLLLERMQMLSATRSHRDVHLSGESKMWDFLAQRALLESVATTIETGINQILGVYERMTGTPQVPKRFALNRNYDPRSLKETLETIYQAMALALGETVTTKLKYAARDALRTIGVVLTDEERAQSDREILEQQEAQRNLEVLTQQIMAPMQSITT